MSELPLILVIEDEYFLQADLEKVLRARPEIIPTSKIEKCRDIGKIELRSTQLFLYGPLVGSISRLTASTTVSPALTARSASSS